MWYLNMKNASGSSSSGGHLLQLRRSGAHPKVISGILGHSGVELAMEVYDHVEAEDFRGPLDQLLQDVMKSGAVAS